MSCRDIRWGSILLLLLGAMSGCAVSSGADQVRISRSHLDQQDALLEAALGHLNEAWRRLLPETDAHLARPELFAGLEGVRQAKNTGQEIRADITGLSQTVTSLQQQIDDHRDDWLGPRARRIRNRCVILIVLFSIGAALLRLGPLLGGPFGGGAIIAGHLLTAFALPLIRGAGSVTRWLASEFLSIWKWGVRTLSRLGSAAGGGVTENPLLNSLKEGAGHAAN